MKKNLKKTAEKDRNIGQILGINIISTSVDELLTRVNNNLTHSSKFYMVTPNPELVLMAQKNTELKKALNGAEFPVPDGVGLRHASRFLYGKDINIIHGRNFFLKLVDLIDKKKGKIFLLGGERGEAETTAYKLKEKYKNIRIETYSGPKLQKNGQPVTEVDAKLQIDAVDKINKFAPDLLFVAFGNPKQEVWISKNIGRLKVGGAMAVGGTFRYIAGLSKLPPTLVEKFELEWLWRLITEPKRIIRIFNAVIVFPLRVLIYKILQK